MHLTTLDFETFWSQAHSLTKMSPIEYVMHPETEIISCSIKVADGPTEVYFGEADARGAFDRLDPDTLAIAHNMSMFDAMVLAWRIGWRPRMWGCTMAMARPLFERTVGISLAKLVRELKLGVKDSTALTATKGRHLCDFTPAEIEDMRVYNRDDTELCYRLFKWLRPHTSNREMWTIDSNIRMLVDDTFRLNTPLLREALRREQAKKHKTLMALANTLGFEPAESDDATARMVRTELMSAAKFSKLLVTLGVEVPMKPSPKDEDKLIPALAKDDPEFQELVEHDNDMVAAAAQARLEMKSTLLETRIQAFVAAGEARGGTLPIPAKYYGAHTGRDSGELYNALNMPRIDWDNEGRMVPKLTNALRLSLLAPKGKVVIVADLSGIEMRINHFLWCVAYSTARWRSDPRADIYRPTAAGYYEIDEAAVDKQQRQFGKVLQLACGFQVGGKKFQSFARKFGIHLTLEAATEGVYGWRNMTPEIADRDNGGWAKCQAALDYIKAGQERLIDPWGLAQTCAEGIRLTPDDRLIRYFDLRQQVNERNGRVEWKYGTGRFTRYIYGGSMDENIVQALGRTILMDNVMEFFRRTGLRPALRVYDEAAYVVEERHAADLLKELLQIMRTPPKWWPELVVWSEGDMAVSYGQAK
jgi:hypothetical protein